MIIPSVLDLCGKALVAGVCSCGFCEKLLEASHVSSRPSASPLQDGPAAGQGCTPAAHGGSQWVRVVPKGACQDCAGQKLWQKLTYRWHYLREVVRSRGHFFPLYFYFFHIVFCVRLDFNAQVPNFFCAGSLNFGIPLYLWTWRCFGLSVRKAQILSLCYHLWKDDIIWDFIHLQSDFNRLERVLVHLEFWVVANRMNNITYRQPSRICRGCGPDGFDIFMMRNFGFFMQINSESERNSREHKTETPETMSS